MNTNEGTISHCEQSGCNWKCCKFVEKGHIVIFPNELNQADGKTDHLEIIGEEISGGLKVKCRAKDKSTCDGGYKPIQCGLYPIWINPKEVMRSMKCPMKQIFVVMHEKKAQSIISEYRKRNPDINIDDFLNRVFVDRYIPIDFTFHELNSSFLEDILEIEDNFLIDPKECFKSDESDIYKCLESKCSIGIIVNGELIAYTLVYFNEYQNGYLEKSFVHPSYRGNGIQYKMNVDVLDKLHDKGVKDVYTMVSPSNLASFSSFSKSGFKLLRKAKIQGQDRIILKHGTDN